MAKLILKYEDRILKEFPVGAEEVPIGRLPDNTVVIDNPAVSSHHARLLRVGELYVLKDLQSTNGTFVNEQRITQHNLQNGDVVQVGKHTLVFVHTTAEETAPVIPDIGGTVFLETKAQKELLAKAAGQAGASAARPAPAPGPAAAPRAETAVLKVLAGSADRSEYPLRGQTSVIGKSDTALVRLRGLFKPRVAVVIARKGESYVVTPLGGKPQVNRQPMREHQRLQDGDILRVSGLTLQFNLKR